MPLPSLLDLCVQSAASSRHWTFQRRSLERLPDHAANELLEQLLLRQSALLQAGQAGATARARAGGAAAASDATPPLRPATLTLFRHSVTRVVLRGPGVTAEWLAALAAFSNLDTLHLTGCSKLTVAALQLLLVQAPQNASASSRASSPHPATPTTPDSTTVSSARRSRIAPQPQLSTLSPAAACLRHLDLSGCIRLAADSLPLLARLTALQSLNISETGIQGPGLASLGSLTGLTRLQAGGLKCVGDEAWLALLAPLTGLQHLELWGSEAGGGPGGGEALLLLLAAGLPRLRQLSAAWTALTTLPALPELQVLDMRHCRLREVWWPAGQPTRLALRRLLLRGASLAGPAAAAADQDSASGLGCLIRHAAATLEHLDLCEVSCADPWVAPLAALAGPTADDVDDANGAAAQLTHLDISRTAVRPEDLVHLQGAPLLQLLAAEATSAGSVQGAAALVAAGLLQLQDLDLTGSSVTDGAVSWLQQLTALTALSLAANPELTLAPSPAPLPPAQPRDPDPAFQPPQPLQLPQPTAFPDVWAADAAPAGAGGAGGNSSSATAAAVSVRDNAVGSSGDGSVPFSSSSRAAHGAGDDAGVWPQLRRLNLLGTRVGEAGLRALLLGAPPTAASGVAAGGGGSGSGSGSGGGGAGRGGGGRRPAVGSGSGGLLRRLEQLKLGGPGVTDGSAAALAAAGLPSLHSLLVRDAPLTGHGALQLATGSLPSLRRLELQACWLVSDQDAARLAAACGPGAVVVVNGKAAGGAVPAAMLTAGRAGGAGNSRGRAPTVHSLGRAGVAGSGGGQRGAGVGTSAADDLSCFDQRLRYDTSMLLQLAASPLVGGSGGNGSSSGGIAGSGGGAVSGVPPWVAGLPTSVRR